MLAFHGGGGTGRWMRTQTRFDAVAEREGFLVAYPDGHGRQWNDGRETAAIAAQREKIDDVAFIAKMIDAVAREHPVDPKRIYATGISNGAIFSHFLAAHLAPRIAAFAPVVGGIADPFHRRFKPAAPVSVLILQNTDDPLVPYEGGELRGIARGRGKIIATDEAVKLWVARNGCVAEPKPGDLADKDSTDGTRARWFLWSPCKEKTEVKLIRIEGGGHTWPGGSQYLPQRLVGKVSRDFDASEVIWEFFRDHPKP